MPYCYVLQQWRAGLGIELKRNVWQILAMSSPSTLVRKEITTFKIETTFLLGRCIQHDDYARRMVRRWRLEVPSFSQP